MEHQQLIKELHPLEIRVLLHFKRGDSINPGRLQQELGYKPGQSNQAFAWLEAKQLIEETDRTKITEYSITDLGLEYREKGTPEERLLSLVQKDGPSKLPEAASKLGLENKEVGSAFGAAAGWGLLAMNEQKQVMCKDESKQE